MNDNNRDGSWFQLGVQILLISSLLGMFYGIFLAHTLVTTAPQPTKLAHYELTSESVVAVNEMNFDLEGCNHFTSYELMVDGSDIPATDYQVVCDEVDTGYAHVEFRRPLALARAPRVITFFGYNI